MYSQTMSCSEKHPDKFHSGDEVNDQFQAFLALIVDEEKQSELTFKAHFHNR